MNNRYGQLTISQWAYMFLTGLSSCKFSHNAAVIMIHKNVMSCVSICVFELIFVNKSLFAATKVDFQYFGHIFV